MTWPNRREPMKRSWFRRRPPRRLDRQGQEPAYLAFVHTQPCVFRELDPGGCGTAWGERHIEADHGDDDKGAGQRHPDSWALPVCGRHHRHPAGQWVLREPWLSWPKWQRHEWLQAARARLRAAWLALTPGAVAPSDVT